VVQGDTNSVLAGALAACKIGVKVAHVEAGLRSYDRRMPEEYNRIATDHVSDFLYPPTKDAARNLKRERIGMDEFLTSTGKRKAEVLVTGNTIVDATEQNIKLAKEKRKKLVAELGLKPKGYFLITLHRAENVDHKGTLQGLVKLFQTLAEETGMVAVWPIHPRTTKRLQEFGITLDEKQVKTLPPQGYLSFLVLENHARLILTDSGGVVEEACTLKVPTVILRKTTERMEAVKAGAAALGGVETQTALEAARRMLQQKARFRNPFGKGDAAARIVAHLQEQLSR